jgi:hypothetical protein
VLEIRLMDTAPQQDDDGAENPCLEGCELKQERRNERDCQVREESGNVSPHQSTIAGVYENDSREDRRAEEAEIGKDAVKEHCGAPAQCAAGKNIQKKSRYAAESIRLRQKRLRWNRHACFSPAGNAHSQGRLFFG